MVKTFSKIFLSGLAFLFILVLLVSFASASFNFQGYTKYANGTNMTNVNVSIEVTEFQENAPPSLVVTLSNFSDETSYFNLTINDTYDNVSYFYKPVIMRYNGTAGNGTFVEYIGQSLPEFPQQEISMLGDSSITFYLKQAITIDLSVVGNTHTGTSIIYGANYSIGEDYSAGLDIQNYSNVKKYSYINSSNCLVILNETREVNSSFCDLNITNDIIDLESYVGGPGEDSYYLLNSTKIERCLIESGGSVLNCNSSADISGLDYSVVDGIEIVYSGLGDPNLILTGINATTGIHVITKFLKNLTFSGDGDVPDFPSGKMEYVQGKLFFASNNTNIYALYYCYVLDGFNLNCGGPDGTLLNFTATQNVSGIAYDMFEDQMYYSTNASNNMTQINTTTNIYTFYYQVKDTTLGYPVKNSWNSAVTSSRFFIPSERNYSMMIYPNDGPGFPARIDLDNLVEGENISFGEQNATIQAIGGGLYVNLSNANVTTDFVQLAGYINTSLGDENFTNLTVIGFLLEGGNMVYKGSTLPSNMGRWQNPQVNDLFNTTTGFYNMTLPASVLGANLLLLSSAIRNESNTLVYYGGFRNVSLIYGDSTEETNFTLYPLIGEVSNLTVGFDGQPDASQVETKQHKFMMQNNGSNISQAHVEIELDYSSFEGSSVEFSWMAEVGNDDDGALEIPLFNYSIKKMQIFSPQFAPLKKQFSQLNLQENPTYINLTEFESKDASGEAITDVEMMIYIHKEDGSCTVPYPDASCSPFGGENSSEFNPFALVIGGGKLDFEIKKTSNNITVRYVNVDLLASGPPDAMFDESSTKTTSGSAIDESWKFGSMGPEIYEYILLGVPYDTSTLNENGDIKVNITKMYNEDWDATWQQGSNETTDLTGTDYEDYTSGDYIEYLNGTGVLCSFTNENLSSGICYKDTANNMLWFKIPHFSGIGPSIVGNAIIATTNPPSGGGSGGGITDIVISETQFNAGFTGILNLNKKIKFTINNQSHYVLLNSLTNLTAKLTIASTPQETTLTKGDTRKFEINDDGYYDLSITLNNISFSNGIANGVNLTVKSINETITSASIAAEQEKEKESEEVANQETGKSSAPTKSKDYTIWMIIALILVVTLGIVLFIKKRNRFY